MKKILVIWLILFVVSVNVFSQDRRDYNQNYPDGNFNMQNGEFPSDYLSLEDSLSQGFGMRAKGPEKKKSKKIPIRLRTWRVTNDFGVCDSIVPDTVSHMFQNSNFSDGMRGEYNILGNHGSPRQARLFALRPIRFSYFFFADPYDYFITPFSSLDFTNTLSPITNISYHECGGSDNGEDRIRALYAVNAGKDIGIGFKLDYLYGRGFYDHQSTSDFNATFWGSVHKERYKAHFAIYTNYLKIAENGGITDDDYVSNPEKFPSKFDTNDIPTNLTRVWNKMYVSGLHLTHRYSIGFRKGGVDTTRVINDSLSQNDSTLLATKILVQSDSAQSSLMVQGTSGNQNGNAIVNPTDSAESFVPVTSFIHTLKVQDNSRKFIANQSMDNFYTNKYFAGDSAQDNFRNLYVSNQLAVELQEGFNKWAMAGIRLFVRHEYNRYEMPVSRWASMREAENRITLGGNLFKEKGRNIRYSLLAQTSGDGDTWGEFELSAKAHLNFQLGRDTINFKAFANVVNMQPTYFYRHYRSQYLCWDNDLSKQNVVHLGGVLSSEVTHTRLAVDLQNIKNYTYFQNIQTKASTTEGTPVYTMNTNVRQYSDNIQLLSLTLNQDFHLGILNWENQLTYQTTTQKEILPLPAFSAYTNLYLLFRIAKVLRVELGADARYFTLYKAPTYSPAVGMYATQDPESAVEVGNHPVINAYVNFHLKHTRFYVMASHVNYSGNGGSVFLAPHYPYNPFVLHLGLSWNFFN